MGWLRRRPEPIDIAGRATNTCDVTILSASLQPSDFDPTAGRFAAQASRPADWLDVAPASLSPLLRTLLVVDGTVTKVLEAFFLEGIEVRRLMQTISVLDAADEWLDAEPGAEVVDRSVVLLGRETGRVYTFAQSRIMLDRLSVRMRNRLDDKLLGLGRILVDSAVEARRECLWYGRQRLAVVPPELESVRDQEFVCRTYRVIAGGRPLMTITERFPAGLAR
jgi:chorismate-pyruvate lyase